MVAKWAVTSILRNLNLHLPVKIFPPAPIPLLDSYLPMECNSSETVLSNLEDGSGRPCSLQNLVAESQSSPQPVPTNLKEALRTTSPSQRASKVEREGTPSREGISYAQKRPSSLQLNLIAESPSTPRRSKPAPSNLKDASLSRRKPGMERRSGTSNRNVASSAQRNTSEIQSPSSGPPIQNALPSPRFGAAAAGLTLQILKGFSSRSP
ncbi:hypothetical protein DFH07DRAFT_775781 [Mycena maculata]|uniref:Uncharacterized protein n=1 Tax=Mycena maculata TaxID=230809 RepID=A0AAD7IT50_9AGAR|nr:hypothetical protein DFH07DRAFT_775781 [Mycena maculata]